jgi:hypothetical protein
VTSVDERRVHFVSQHLPLGATVSVPTIRMIRIGLVWTQVASAGYVWRLRLHTNSHADEIRCFNQPLRFPATAYLTLRINEIDSLCMKDQETGKSFCVKFEVAERPWKKRGDDSS